MLTGDRIKNKKQTRRHSASTDFNSERGRWYSSKSARYKANIADLVIPFKITEFVATLAQRNVLLLKSIHNINHLKSLKILTALKCRFDQPIIDDNEIKYFLIFLIDLFH